MGPRIRVIDLETTGLLPTDHIVEIAAIDVVGSEIVVVGSDLYRVPEALTLLGFPKQRGSDSTWRTEGWSPCRLR